MLKVSTEPNPPAWRTFTVVKLSMHTPPHPSPTPYAPPPGLVRGLHVHDATNHAEGDGEDEEAFEKRLAALKGKRGTPSRSGGGGGGDDALTPYQQLKKNQAEQKDRKQTGARALCRCLSARAATS